MTETKENYLTECRELSLTAKMAIALLSFEKFCRENGIISPLINELSDHLWKWPLRHNDSMDFSEWESSKPYLVNYGLGDIASSELTATLDACGIDEERFRKIVEGLIAILYINFWCAADNEKTMEALSDCLKATKAENYPPLTPFRFSLFSDMHGWGKHISREDLNFWRTYYT